MDRTFYIVLAIVIGVLLGLLYWKFFGCSHGNCSLTSSPIISALIGGLLGILGFTIFYGDKEKVNSKKTTVIKEIKMKTMHLTKSEFISKVNNFESNSDAWKYLGDKPAIIDFYATWCGPCKSLSPILEEIAGEFEGKIYVYKVDVDKEEDIAAAFNVRSIPTLLFVPMEGEPQIMMGMQSKQTLRDAVNNVLLK